MVWVLVDIPPPERVGSTSAPLRISVTPIHKHLATSSIPVRNASLVHVSWDLATIRGRARGLAILCPHGVVPLKRVVDAAVKWAAEQKDGWSRSAAQAH